MPVRAGDRASAGHRETVQVQRRFLEGRNSADLTAFKKKGWIGRPITMISRKPRLRKAVQEKETLALKLEQSMKKVEDAAIEQTAVAVKEKAEALPRPARPPPWRDKLQPS